MRDLTSGPEGRLVFTFAVPMLIGNLFQQLYNMVDSMVVGQFVGKEALAAVGVSFPILFLLIALVMGMGLGSSILLAQYYGAKNMKGVRRTVETTYIFLFWASLAVTAIGLAAGGAILRLLRTPAEILPLARQYLNILFAGMILMFGYNSLAAILRGLGDSKTPLYFLIVATLANVVLDLVFVLVFHWGVPGVAWATVLAQGLSFLLGLLYLRRPQLAVLRIHLVGMRFDPQIFRRSIQIGLPSAVQQVLVAMGMLVLFRIVNAFGTSTIAAYTAGTRLETFATMPAMNFAMALSAFVGQNVGAAHPPVQRRCRRGGPGGPLPGHSGRRLRAVFHHVHHWRAAARGGGHPDPHAGHPDRALGRACPRRDPAVPAHRHRRDLAGNARRLGGRHDPAPVLVRRRPLEAQGAGHGRIRGEEAKPWVRRSILSARASF